NLSFMQCCFQPWRCLWRGFVQMTMVRPCRLMTRQRSHMGFTDGRTFMRGKRAQAFACRRGPSSYQDPCAPSQPARPVRGDRDGVLEMGRERAVGRRNRPVVVVDVDVG